MYMIILCGPIKLERKKSQTLITSGRITRQQARTFSPFKAEPQTSCDVHAELRPISPPKGTATRRFKCWLVFTGSFCSAVHCGRLSFSMAGKCNDRPIGDGTCYKLLNQESNFPQPSPLVQEYIFCCWL